MEQKTQMSHTIYNDIIIITHQHPYLWLTPHDPALKDKLQGPVKDTFSP